MRRGVTGGRSSARVGTGSVVPGVSPRLGSPPSLECLVGATSRHSSPSTLVVGRVATWRHRSSASAVVVPSSIGRPLSRSCSLPRPVSSAAVAGVADRRVSPSPRRPRRRPRRPRRRPSIVRGPSDVVTASRRCRSTVARHSCPSSPRALLLGPPVLPSSLPPCRLAVVARPSLPPSPSLVACRRSVVAVPPLPLGVVAGSCASPLAVAACRRSRRCAVLGVPAARCLGLAPVPPSRRTPLPPLPPFSRSPLPPCPCSSLLAVPLLAGRLPLPVAHASCPVTAAPEPLWSYSAVVAVRACAASRAVVPADARRCRPCRRSPARAPRIVLQ